MTTYLIAGALFILIIALIVAYRSPKKKKTDEVPEQETIFSKGAEETQAFEEETTGAVEVAVSEAEDEETGQEPFPEEADAPVIDVEEEADSVEGLDESISGDQIGDDTDQAVAAEIAEEVPVDVEETEAVPSAASVEDEPEEMVSDLETIQEEAYTPVEEEEVAAVEEPPALTVEKYTAHLSALEEKIRSELDWAIQNHETVKRTLLEPKLQVVCEMQAADTYNFNRTTDLIKEISNLLEQVQEALPGFDNDATRRQLQFGEFEVVEAMLNEISSQLDDDSELASRVYYARGQMAEEMLDYFGAYENYRKAYAADTDNKKYLLSAGRMARMTGNDQDAQFWLEKLVRMGIEKGEKSLEQSIAQHELGLVCVRTDQKEKGGALFKRSIEIKEQVLGSEHHELGPVMHDYGILFEGNGMYEQAEKLYKKSIEVTEKEFGDAYPGLGSTLNKLAGIYEEMELADQSEPLYIRALDIKEKVLGKEHLDVGTILNHLAELLRRQGRHEEAEPMFLRSLDISEKELGPEHPNLTIVLNNLAELYSAMGREEEAAKFQERAFSLFDLPGGGGDFVEMEKDEDFDIENDKDQSVT